MAAALAALAGGTALPAPADPLSVEEFERLVTGRTLYYGIRGRAYGAEQYLPGRRVLWSFLDDHCEEGRYYQDGQAICFVYDTLPEPQCWIFEAFEDGRIGARYVAPNGALAVIEVERAEEPLSCPGPEPSV
ncbi:MAG: hypothetical protein D6688_14665 [Alphaproteobacteria bacterium]|nr:MAG: hypothetical protein D6688_14665 [Alphaproteobacteria bacterium]